MKINKTIMENIANVLGVWLVLIIVFLILFFVVQLYVVYEMAINRGRSPGTWLLFSFILLSPLVIMFCLLCLGETDDKRRDRLLKDEEFLRIFRK